MKLTPPYYNIIRFDTDDRLAKDQKGLNILRDLKCELFPPENEGEEFGIGIKLRFILSVGDVANEVGGLTVEADSFILEFKNEFNDKLSFIMHLSNVFDHCRNLLKEKMPYIEIGAIKKPAYDNVADTIIEDLNNRGFQK
jgi:hypothetical protein